MAPRSIAHSGSIAAFIPELERLIADAMDEWKIPGLAMTVVQNGEVALARAYGLRDAEAGLKVTTDTQFLIGSITARTDLCGGRGVIPVPCTTCALHKFGRSAGVLRTCRSCYRHSRS
jgi:hypothetical protein